MTEQRTRAEAALRELLKHAKKEGDEATRVHCTIALRALTAVACCSCNLPEATDSPVCFCPCHEPHTTKPLRGHQYEYRHPYQPRWTLVQVLYATSCGWNCYQWDEKTDNVGHHVTIPDSSQVQWRPVDWDDRKKGSPALIEPTFMDQLRWNERDKRIEAQIREWLPKSDPLRYVCPTCSARPGRSCARHVMGSGTFTDPCKARLEIARRNA